MNWNFSSLVCGKDFLFAIDCKLEAIKIFFLTLGSVEMFFLLRWLGKWKVLN